MEKVDVEWMVLALGILVVIALVIAPFTTGKPANLGISLNFSLPPLSPVQPLNPVTTQTTMATLPATPPPALTPERTTTPVPPTPTLTGNSSAVQTLQFVDPSTYGLDLSGVNSSGSRIPLDIASIRANVTTIATFSGQYSGTTQAVHIPYPYWELWYTVDPVTTYVREGTTVIAVPVLKPTDGVSRTGYQGSYSSAMPTFTITIMEDADPDTMIREVSPPGGIDPTLWKAGSNSRISSSSGSAITYADPRPWKEKFYEGQKNYYFIIKAGLLKSYTINIKVPNSYIGRY